jgi:hypothetical protein
MNFPEFCRGMKYHFKITDGVNTFVDASLSTTSNAVLDIYKFDSWLHGQFGTYELKQGKSMKDVIKDEYGVFALRFVEQALGFLEDLEG